MKELISPDDSGQGADALTVINALMERDWRIVHIARTRRAARDAGPVPTKPGDPPQQLINPRGVVLSGDSFLGPREIQSMRVVPELVFVNCCHLAALVGRGADVRPAALCRERRRRADQHWRALCRGRRLGGRRRASDDLCDNVYASLLRGQRFLDAVAEARTAAHAEAATPGPLTSATAIPTGCFAAMFLTHSNMWHQWATSSPASRHRPR